MTDLIELNQINVLDLVRQLAQGKPGAMMLQVLLKSEDGTETWYGIDCILRGKEDFETTNRTLERFFRPMAQHLCSVLNPS